MLLKLPTELRLRIADYALEQHPATGIPPTSRQLQEYRADYRPSGNLALLLVCRQFNSDFTQLAYSKTRFSIWNRRQSNNLRQLPSHSVRNIRSIVHRAPVDEVTSWGSYCYGLQQLHLDELVILCDRFFFVISQDVLNVAAFLRRLLHVKIIRFVMYDDKAGRKRSHYCRLIGAIMKEDHFQRYDAPGAPNIEARWWDWHLNSLGDMIAFTAQEPRPVLPEEEYMLLMKPKVDAMMAEAERAAGL
ncbi:hypothetical protein E8E11_000877 [Didymella keratinophila]|nr:hypothetical protein E8E11_000877 [Didymella keratinophila]